MQPGSPNLLELAARAIREADALLITAGAGMGVDSGLPDFRGTEGFWRAYPAFAKLGLEFEELANPHWFARDPHLAWGFYGHRLMLYRATTPHAGFEILKRWSAAKPSPSFVFTSNVDGHFQRAGFDAGRVLECHGSIHHLQCSRPCRDDIWEADAETIEVDLDTMRAADPLPRCPACGSVARPNVLMFGDSRWLAARTKDQAARYAEWFTGLSPDVRLVVIECGAGSAVPTVRLFSEGIARTRPATLIRINVREPHGPPGTIGIPMSAVAALEQMDRLGAV